MEIVAVEMRTAIYVLFNSGKTTTVRRKNDTDIDIEESVI